MRTVFFSICIAALIPLNSFAMDIAAYNSDKKENSNTRANASQKQRTGAIEILLQDHNQIKKMVGQLEKSVNTKSSKNGTSFKELKTFLENHENMEQKVWYPELEKNDELKKIVDKLIEQEKAAGDQLKELDDNDKEWSAKVKKLITDVKKHARDEETTLFPKVRKALDKAKLDEIGKKMNEYKSEHDNNNKKH